MSLFHHQQFIFENREVSKSRRDRLSVNLTAVHSTITFLWDIPANLNDLYTVRSFLKNYISGKMELQNIIRLTGNMLSCLLTLLSKQNEFFPMLKICLHLKT